MLRVLKYLIALVDTNTITPTSSLINEKEFGVSREKVYDELKKHNIYARNISIRL